MKAWNSTLRAPTKPMQRGRMPDRKFKPNKKTALKKSSRKDKAYLEACRGQHCYLAVPGVCLGASGRETVVPCHSNQLAHGKGMGIKAADKFSVPGCMACHAWLDQSGAAKQEKFAAFDRAYLRWVEYRDGKNNE